MPAMPPALTIVGLGPGDPALLTLAARDALAAASEVWLRTARHPAVPDLPPGPAYRSFDDVYESAETFDAVYETIVARVLDLARRPEGVVYAVPGHPLFGEATVRALLTRAPEAGIATRIVPGVSFVDTVSLALGLDPLSDGLLVLDALALDPHGRRLMPERPTVVAQIYDRAAASRAKLALLEAYPAHHPVRVVSAPSADAPRVVTTTLAKLDHEDVFDHLATLYLPSVPVAEDVRTFEGLRGIVAQLRAPEGGCPWDLEQTHETLKRYLLEEAYEAIDALGAGDPARLAEELGDLLMQVVLHAQVAEDEGEFVVEDVIGAIAAKLVRRHPHVFGEVEVAGADEVVRNWEVLKKEERGDAPVLDAVPKAMPALAQAQSVHSRAAKAGLAGAAPSLAPVAHMLQKLERGERIRGDELGAALFALAAAARANELDAEESLRLEIRRFREDVARREQARASA